ncbi:uncharacterized protein LOC108023562 isoform X1 [Drosophila biarmipes]|uniref:uncharacterized protein LOC108023562 isoform X1 n=1 Tax=Drosophila biarmipes TaxID=125945 RepID=UPI0021CC9ED6|nr:uncharacterized protein LOC108023562 isoform X1 [Drosophila biarmipes]XP_050746591.1 uncharacterized protein LOC108023562 isoform X1 [Drosophila biarmipes]XP_050746592.1 uncharacterized protein LOC108023562 isoform X1 [Drosophila biarmipes]XP_050746593.1 uncharacterized protein LOC108023562 isoform X1 [Drosophila biarmipes]
MPNKKFPKMSQAQLKLLIKKQNQNFEKTMIILQPPRYIQQPPIREFRRGSHSVSPKKPPKTEARPVPPPRNLEKPITVLQPPKSAQQPPIVDFNRGSNWASPRKQTEPEGCFVAPTENSEKPFSTLQAPRYVRRPPVREFNRKANRPKVRLETPTQNFEKPITILQRSTWVPRQKQTRPEVRPETPNQNFEKPITILQPPIRDLNPGSNRVSCERQGKPKVPPETPTPETAGGWQHVDDVGVLVLQKVQVSQVEEKEQNPKNDAKQWAQNPKNDDRQKQRRPKNATKLLKQNLENEARQGEQGLEEDDQQSSKKQVRRKKRALNKTRGKDGKDRQKTRRNQEQAASEDSPRYRVGLSQDESGSLSSSVSSSSASSSGPKADEPLANFPSLETLHKTAWSFFSHPHYKPVETPPSTAVPITPRARETDQKDLDSIPLQPPPLNLRALNQAFENLAASNPWRQESRAEEPLRPRPGRSIFDEYITPHFKLTREQKLRLQAVVSQEDIPLEEALLAVIQDLRKERLARESAASPAAADSGPNMQGYPPPNRHFGAHPYEVQPEYGYYSQPANGYYPHPENGFYMQSGDGFYMQPGDDFGFQPQPGCGYSLAYDPYSHPGQVYPMHPQQVYPMTHQLVYPMTHQPVCPVPQQPQPKWDSTPPDFMRPQEVDFVSGFIRDFMPDILGAPDFSASSSSRSSPSSQSSRGSML